MNKRRSKVPPPPPSHAASRPHIAITGLTPATAREVSINMQAEVGLLAAVFKSPKCLHDLGGLFRPDLFRDPDHIQLATILAECARTNRATSSEFMEAVANAIIAGRVSEDATRRVLDKHAHIDVGFHLSVLTEGRMREALRAGIESIRAGLLSGSTATDAFKQLSDLLLRVGQSSPGAIEERSRSSATPVMTCMAEVQPRQVSWLWPGRIPLGRLTLFVGLPGEGKSFATTDMAARVTTGIPWPDQSPCPQGSVILISAEDDPGDTTRPRLDAHGADVRRVHKLDAVRRVDQSGKQNDVLFTLADVDALEAALKRHQDCKMVIIDPIGSFLGGRTDSDKDNAVRAVLAPISKLAEKYGPAVLIVAHRRKSNGTRADDLAIGSRAFTGIARAVWHLSRDPDNKDRRLFLAGKNNLCRESDGMAFTIEGDGLDAHICWEPDPVSMNADEGLAAEGQSDDSRPGPAPTARKAAAEWLRSVMANGEIGAGEVKEQAKSAGINWKTVQRAAEELGVRRVKAAFGAGWRWTLPSEEDTKGTRRGHQGPSVSEPVLLSPSINTKKNDDSSKFLAQGDKFTNTGVGDTSLPNEAQRMEDGR